MTIDGKYMNELERSTLIRITPEQRQAILDRFSSEPDPYAWSEQDITFQIGNFLGCGEFVKTMRGQSSALSDDLAF
jgi:hypothetical protein